MSGLRRSSASSDDDSLVALSNEEAAWGKYSSVKAGLYGDPVVGLFMRSPDETCQKVLKPQPEIQRGYYIREVIVRLAVKDFIEKNHGCQIVVLGAGYDTLYFFLKRLGLEKHVSQYVELDLPIVVAKKLYYYRRRQALTNMFPDAEFPHPPGPTTPTASSVRPSFPPPPPATNRSETAAPAGGGTGGGGAGPVVFARPDSLLAPGRHASRVRNQSGGAGAQHTQLTPLSPTMPPRESYMMLDASDVEDFSHGNYHLLACDLKAIDQLVQKLQQFVSPAAPTLLLAECVLVYLAADESAALLHRLCEHLPSCAMLLYEQVNMEDAFGRRMVQNVADRSNLTLNVEACGSIETQRQRLLAAGFTSAAGATVHDVYKALPKTESKRVSCQSPLDEANLQEELFRHYAFVLAARGSLAPAVSPLELLASELALREVLALDWK